MHKTPNPADQALTETLALSVTLNMKRRIRQEADRRMLSVSEFTRQAIIARLDAMPANRGGRR